MNPEPDPPSDDAALLRQFLVARNVRCPVCGYNLRGNPSLHCSECGARLNLQIASDDRLIVPWATAILSVAMAFGAAGFVTCVFATIAVVHEVRGVDWPVAATFAVATIVYGFVLGVLIRKRRIIWRMSKPRQWRIAAFCVMLSIGGGCALAVIAMN